MQILTGLDGLRRLPPGAVASIGNFDGVHRGHQRIIDACRQLASELGGRAVAVVTFEPHPLTILRPEAAPPRLMTLNLKEEALCAAGATHLVILPPEPQVLNLSAEDFWRILRDDVRLAGMVEGEEFSFGKGRGGTLEKLRQWTAEAGVRLQTPAAAQAVLTDLSIVRASSSLVRWLLVNGRVRDAAICLGRPYILEGEVIKGFQRGQSLGIPTANLRCDQLIPADGVYAGRVRLNCTNYPAAVSIGKLPTFGDDTRQVEAHLIGFNGDLYGQTIRLELLDWLREQRRFADVEMLKAQMGRDMGDVMQRKTMDPAREIVTE